MLKRIFPGPQESLLTLGPQLPSGVPLLRRIPGVAETMDKLPPFLRDTSLNVHFRPEAAIWVFDTVGLTVFMSVVGLSAGPSFVAGIKTTGVSLIVVGLVVAATPHAVAILFGRHILRMNPLILLGACSGAGMMTAALRAVQEEAQSKLPALGYTVPSQSATSC